MKKIILATGNAGKVKEFREMFAPLGVDVTSLADHFDPIPEIVEDGDTFFDNAKIKADWVFDNVSGIWSLADDSGLEVDALGGAPGVISARYSVGDVDDDNRDDVPMSVRNNEKLLRELQNVPEEKRTARFKCVLVLKMDVDKYITAEGTCEGRIITELVGDKGFGYDPLFIPNGFDQTFAQISSDDKNRISHRGIALKKLYEILNTRT